jgi:hypothetical protein
MGNSLSGDFTRLIPFGRGKKPCRFINYPLFGQMPSASLSREGRHAR